MKVYSRRRKQELLDMLESLLKKGDVFYFDNLKHVVAIDEAVQKKYVIVDNDSVIPYDKFFKIYRECDKATDFFMNISVESKHNTLIEFFEKFFDKKRLMIQCCAIGKTGVY